MLELEHALEKILAEITPRSTETVSVYEASGRIAAEDIRSPIALPLFDNSAMDGYAVQSKDVVNARGDSPVSLRITGKIAAGEDFTGEVNSGECARIFTGSALPKGVDAVVMQEDTKPDATDVNKIWITDAVKPWENIRFRSEDIKEGLAFLQKGERITLGRLSLLGAVGLSEVKVGRRPSVALLATGSELIEPGETPAPGKIYESNRIGLAALCQKAGAIPRIHPLIKDDLAGTKTALEKAFSEGDVVVTSGGVSVGEFDFVKAAFTQMGGELSFWRVAIRPGKPFVFGRWKDKYFFGVPGNPVSALVTFFLLVRPALLRWQGAKDCSAPTYSGILREPLQNTSDRRHFTRVCVDREGGVRSTGVQASHILNSLAQAVGLLDIPAKSALSSGTPVRVSVWD